MAPYNFVYKNLKKKYSMYFPLMTLILFEVILNKYILNKYRITVIENKCIILLKINKFDSIQKIIIL